jgi:hypothetical protein
VIVADTTDPAFDETTIVAPEADSIAVEKMFKKFPPPPDK